MMFPPIDPSVLNGNPQFDKLYSYLTTVALNPSGASRSEEHTSELQSQSNIVCRLLLEKKISRTMHSPYVLSTSPRFRPLLRVFLLAQGPVYRQVRQLTVQRRPTRHLRAPARSARAFLP